MTKEEFKKTIKIMSSFYVNLKFTSENAEAYWMMFKGLDGETFSKACLNSIKESEFFPTVATILRNMQDKKEIPSEMEVVLAIKKEIQRVGIYESPKFDHPLFRLVATEIGWRTCCNMAEEKLNEVIHFRYKGASQDYIKRGDSPLITERIRGLFPEEEKMIEDD